MILLLSHTSVSRGWVQQEYNAALNHQTENPAFRIIPIRLDDVQPPGFLGNYSFMELGADGLDSTAAAALLKGLYQPHGAFDMQNGRNTYLSRGWQPDDAALADDVCTALEGATLQLIGDAEDQQSWDERRVGQIIEDCGAFAAILPYRKGLPMGTSKYVLRAWEMATARGFPCLVVPDPRVELAPDVAARPGLLAARSGSTQPGRLAETAETFAEEWQPPPRPHYAFYATDFEPEDQPVRHAVKELVEAITALPCFLGEHIRGESVAADVPVRLLRQGRPSRPSFMLRDQQVWDYGSDADLLGRVARLTYPFRRSLVRSGSL